MNTYIPPRTRAELANPAHLGSRHEQAKTISVSLIGQGLSADAVFMQLRSMYAGDMPDREIQDLIRWALSKNPPPCGYGTGQRAWTPRQQVAAQPEKPKLTKEQAEAHAKARAIANAEKWLAGFRCSDCDLWHRSPWRPLEDWRLDSIMFLAALYDGADFVNVVTEFSTETKDDGTVKANPSGAGHTMRRDDWMREIRAHGTPQSEAGAWVRMNPCTPEGSGSKGAICDADVTAHRFVLLESDKLPEALALAIYAALPLPIAAIIASAGRGPHAWVKVGAANESEYDELAARIVGGLERIGIDQGNKNPSRLSRLPGAMRQIGASGDGEQRLFYLNPDADCRPIFARGGRA